MPRTICGQITLFTLSAAILSSSLLVSTVPIEIVPARNAGIQRCEGEGAGRSTSYFPTPAAASELCADTGSDCSFDSAESILRNQVHSFSNIDATIWVGTRGLARVYLAWAGLRSSSPHCS